MDSTVIPTIMSILLTSLMFVLVATYYIVWQYRRTKHTLSMFLFMTVTWYYFTNISVIHILNTTSAAGRELMSNPIFSFIRLGLVLVGAAYFLYNTWKTTSPRV